MDDLTELGNALPPSHQANVGSMLPLLSALVAEAEFPGILKEFQAGTDLHSILGGDAYQAPAPTEAEQAAQAADDELDAAKARIAELEAAAAAQAPAPVTTEQGAQVVDIAELQAQQAAQLAAAAAATTTVESSSTEVAPSDSATPDASPAADAAPAVAEPPAVTTPSTASTATGS